MILIQKLGLVGGSIIAFSVVFGFVTFEEILKFGIKDQTALRKRNDVRGIYLKLPFPMEFRIYFFNVSNPMDVQNGATPILEEIGPYSYDEYLEKRDVEDNDGDDSLTYSPYAVFKFNEEKSDELKDDDYVTILHPLIIGIVNQVNKDTPALLSIVNKAIGLIFPDQRSIYLTATVKKILFDGIPINCNVSDFSAKAVCTQLKSKIPGLKVIENNVLLFSVLGPRNDTVGKRVKVSRGISKSKNLGKVLEIDGKKQLSFWGTKQCNTFQGTDSWVFPPFLTPEEAIWTYSTDMCRNIRADFVEETVMKDLNVRRYEADLGDMEHNEEDKCYCETPKSCLKKGVFDLSQCMGVPIFATLPHFLNTDAMYSKQVIGMNPERDNHTIKMFIEPMISAPIEAQKRMQFNFPIAPISKITIMKSIPEALHPLFWVEERMTLEGPLLKKVTNVFLFIKVVKVVRWLGILFGLVIMGYGAYDYFIIEKNLKVTPIHQIETVSRKLEDELDSGSSNRYLNKVNKGISRSVLNGHEFDRY